jgi:hypothetical protein
MRVQPGYFSPAESASYHGFLGELKPTATELNNPGELTLLDRPVANGLDQPLPNVPGLVNARDRAAQPRGKAICNPTPARKINLRPPIAAAATSCHKSLQITVIECCLSTFCNSFVMFD